MLVYNTKLASDVIIRNSTFMCEVADFLRETISKTNITYHTFSGFEFVLNGGRKVKVTYNINYTAHYNLIIVFKLFENGENNITTLVIPLKLTLTEELKEEIEYFIKEYLTENDK